ncbi:ABC-type transport auxiliary lipoprotein family protein [Hyphomicrobium sp.]|uniref:ABC-type transport auxiliary lipoprotein family protein n=1 Tax=Hyphomicrobium sp. TaxID=82 RepID=UPI002D77B8FF|nr:MlaD family protein [Hyphomicrobium sp.]HET6387935.1 MlaD family protein [Hyphomicrobium sp.]
MEIRARYTLIGLFTLSAVAAIFAFVYWLNHAGGLTKQTLYRVRFENTVSGLLKGSGVQFNGIRVGEVIALQLNPENPKQVIAVMSIDRETPVRADTKVEIAFQGLTGSPVLSLNGGAANAPAVTSTDGKPPLLTADPDAGQNMTDSARSVLRHIDAIVTDNAEPLRSLIANINTFSAALARNSDRVDGILSGLERMTGGGTQKASTHVFDLKAADAFPPLTKIPQGQLVIPEPDVVGSVFNDQVTVVTPAGDRSPAIQAKWPDTLSRLVQSRVVQSFDNAGYLKTLGRQPEGLKIDYQLLLDLRSFQVVMSPTPIAEISFSAKIIGENGNILGAKLFEARIPSSISDEASAVAALNQAFTLVITDLVIWTCKTA